MAFYEKTDLKQLNTDSKREAKLWREDYPGYERLADNGLLEGLDENLPEVNDGTLAASLFKLPKRIVSSKLSGTVKAVNRDEAWLTELANLQWRNHIIPNATSQAPFARKWKDAVRKAAIYGSVPIITLFVERNGKRTTDFIVAQPQDVRLEAGKVSDYDSDILFWDIYMSELQLDNMIEQAIEESKATGDNDADSYNKWDIPALKAIKKAGSKDKKSPVESPNQQNEEGLQPEGYHFTVTVQRGVDAPFYMYHHSTNSTVREWTNPDPTGDVPIHYLYCYQDFINPYGIGIVKLAGGTQNVLDYMRKADVLATQLGLRPPVAIEGNEEDVDIESIVYGEDAIWFTGGAKVVRQELASGVYQELPNRIAMYKTSLNQLIPTGDTSISASAGDPNYSKTPAGVKYQAANLSIDDEDFKDNLYVTYAAVAKSMINTHFANMEGADLMKLSDDERQLLIKGGMQFPTNEQGQMSNQVEVQWDTVRATFDFEVDPEVDKAADDAAKLEGLKTAAEFITASTGQPLMASGQKIILGTKAIDPGELASEIISLTTDNDKIVTDVTPDEMATDSQGNPINPAQQAQMQVQTLQQQLADSQKQLETTNKQLQDAKLQLAKEQEVTYKDAPDSIKRQKEIRAGYVPAIGQPSPTDTANTLKANELGLKAADSHHKRAMELIDAATAPNPAAVPPPVTTGAPVNANAA